MAAAFLLHLARPHPAITVPAFYGPTPSKPGVRLSPQLVCSALICTSSRHCFSLRLSNSFRTPLLELPTPNSTISTMHRPSPPLSAVRFLPPHLPSLPLTPPHRYRSETPHTSRRTIIQPTPSPLRLTLSIRPTKSHQNLNRRRRRRIGAVQLTLCQSERLCGFGVVEGGYAWWRSNYDHRRRERNLPRRDH